jgi:hypothetical protein
MRTRAAIRRSALSDPQGPVVVDRDPIAIEQLTAPVRLPAVGGGRNIPEPGIGICPPQDGHSHHQGRPAGDRRKPSVVAAVWRKRSLARLGGVRRWAGA